MGTGPGQGPVNGRNIHAGRRKALRLNKKRIAKGQKHAKIPYHQPRGTATRKRYQQGKLKMEKTVTVTRERKVLIKLTREDIVKAIDNYVTNPDLYEPLTWDDIDWSIDAEGADRTELIDCTIQVVTVDHGEE